MVAAINFATTHVLVPEAEGPSGHGGALSPEERLLTLLVLSDLSRSSAAKESIHLSSEQLDVLREQARQALAAAREAQEESGFWGKLSSLFSGDLASLAEVVAMAAATVTTGGTAALVLGAIAVGATLASKYAEELGIPPNVAIGLGVAAGLVSVASGNLGGGISQLSGLSAAANTTKIYYQGLAVAASTAGSVSQGVEGHYQGEALHAKGDAKGFEHQQVLESANIEANLDLLRDALDAQVASVRATSQYVRNDQQSMQQVLHDFGDVA